jgi:aminoglycoside/choline kinase family phosphotransferase
MRGPGTADHPDTQARIADYLNESGLAPRVVRVVPLTGDASDRRYFRVLRKDGPSVVIALHGGPIEFSTLPFANVASLLAAMPLPVPAILGHSDRHGVVLLEDLGDVTLQAHLGAASVAEHAALYREAVTLIATLQRRGADLADERYLPYRIAFDVEKLTWELDFFVRHFLQAYRGRVLSPAVVGALRDEWGAIVNDLAAEPRVLCHRDYHSRNLMLHQHRLYLIDFQDARLGPDTYDLVSLLRDSYVDLAERDVEDLVACFLALRGAPPGSASEFRRRFDVMALQRNLKALGTFGYQTATRGNPVYIQYIPRTLRYVRTNLEKHERFGRLRDLLAAQIDELG